MEQAAYPNLGGYPGSSRSWWGGDRKYLPLVYTQKK